MSKVMVEVDTDIMNYMGFVISNDYIHRSVIEDIKQEIEEKAKEREFYLDSGHPHNGLYEALEIIDKYTKGDVE